jgi:hypothetical protein
VFAGFSGNRLYCTDTIGEIPLIGIHGGMGIDGGTLRVQPILGLADYGVRVIIPDERGHGQSASDDQNALTHSQWIEDLRDLAAELNLGRFALLGLRTAAFFGGSVQCLTRARAKFSPSTSAFAARRVNETLEMSVPHSRVSRCLNQNALAREDISSEDE